MSAADHNRGLDVYIGLLNETQFTPLRYNDHAILQFLITVEECIKATYATPALRRAAWKEVEQEVRLQIGLTQDVAIATNGWFLLKVLECHLFNGFRLDLPRH